MIKQTYSKFLQRRWKNSYLLGPQTKNSTISTVKGKGKPIEVIKSVLKIFKIHGSRNGLSKLMLLRQGRQIAQSLKAVYNCPLLSSQIYAISI